MSDLTWSEAAELFADLLDLPNSEREDELEQRTAGRPELREAVDGLLVAHEKADPDFLAGVEESLAESALAEAQSEPVSAGVYKLVREIGRGGMGTVYLGERSDGQFEQRVAIKMLRRGMDSEAILQRFLRERQILASLEHTNVARLLDGGVASDGRPYFVMEYVEGSTLTEYADSHQLSVDDRLNLFDSVCHAVAYAHRSLIVHRDLKPSNILVAADGLPKLLDFGIAKLLDPEAHDRSDTTVHGGRPLTPQYAAPEQLTGSAITTSTDVYGLGLVLYELLSGRRAFERKDTDQGPGRSPTEEPQLLSGTSTLGAQEIATAASARATDPERLQKELSGDLATILAKALRAEPGDRYASVDALREDLDRYRTGLPIRARPATLGYRVSRFVRRHRRGVGVAAVIAVLLTGFGVVSTVQALRIQAQAVALTAERDRARTEAATAQRVTEFMVGVFQSADPFERERGDSVTAGAILERGKGRIDAELQDDPELRARLLDVMGAAYTNLGSFEEAEETLESALEARRAAFGNTDPRLAESLRLVGLNRAALEDMEGSERAFRDALEVLAPLGDDHPSVFATRVELSGILHRAGRHDEARVVASQLAANIPDFAESTEGLPRETLMDLGTAFIYAADYQPAVEVFAALAELELNQGGSESLPLSLAIWAQAKGEDGLQNHEAADSLYRAAMDIRMAVASDDPATGNLLLEYARFVRDAGDLVSSDSLAWAAREIYVNGVGEDHIWTAQTDMAIAAGYYEAEQYQRAADRYDIAITAFRSEGSRTASVLLPVAEWRGGRSNWRAGQIDRAEEQLRKAESAFMAAYGADYLFTAEARRDLGGVLIDGGNGVEAIPHLQEALRVLGARWGPDDPRSQDIRVDLARAHALGAQWEEARTILAEVMPRLEEAADADEEVLRKARAALASLEAR